jgi:ribonuclease HII
MPTIKRKPDFPKNTYEQLAWSESTLVCGVDEVGRGCLAGPVVAAAVVLPVGKTSRLLKDSKLLQKDELLRGYAWIIKHCWYGVGIVHHRLIDQHNIYQATLRAMKRAVMQLRAKLPAEPTCILVDAMPLQIDSFAGDIIHFIYGETKSSSIAAASILAKVTRDTLMQDLERSFPGYALAQHKGYSTALHKTLIQQRGLSIVHRTSFTRWMDNPIDDEQISIFDQLPQEKSVIIYE